MIAVALNPIDMKGMIPRTHEISDMENSKNIKERYIQAGNQREQEKRTEVELSQVKESEKSEGDRIRREQGGQELNQEKGRDKREEDVNEEGKEEYSGLKSLNVSVDSKRLKVGKKIDMKV